MKFMQPKGQNGVPLVDEWTPEPTRAPPFLPLEAIADEFGGSPIDRLKEYLREYAVFQHRAEPNIAVRWGRLIAAAQIAEKRNVNLKELELVLVGDEPEFHATVLSDYLSNVQEISWRVGDVAPKHLQYDTAAADFSPSNRLIDIWIESITKLAREAGQRPQSEFASHKDDLRQELRKMLIDTLGTLAQQLRYESGDAQLTRNGEFSSRAQIEICDTFLILPSMSGEFLRLLKYELAAAVKSGWELRGAWGKLELTDTDELRFALEKVALETEAGFVRARRVE